MPRGSKRIDSLDFERKIFEVPHRSKDLLFLPSLVSLYEISPEIKSLLENKASLINKQRIRTNPSKDPLSKAYVELKEFASEVRAAISDLPIWGKNSAGENLKYQICTLDIFLTHSCNMDCSYCCAKGGNFGLNFKPAMMNWQTAKKTLDWLFGNNKNGKYPLTISFFGGEPLLNRGVFKQSLEYIYMLRKKNNYPSIRQVITTNGTLLDDEIFELLDKYSCDLCVSLDASRGSHDQKRRFKNGGKTYDLVTDKIRQAIRRYPNLKIETNSTLCSEDDIRDFFSKPFISKRIFRRYNIEHSITRGFLENKDIDRKFISEFNREFTRRYHYILKHGWRPPNTFNDYFILAKLNSVDKKRIYRRTTCSAGLTKAGVATNGDIYVCGLSLQYGKKWKIGNVFKGIETRKRLSVLNQYQQILQSRKLCASCWARYLCGGMCILSKIKLLPSLEDKTSICNCRRLYVEHYLRYYALIESENTLKEIMPKVIKDYNGKAFSFDELCKHTFIFKRLESRKYNYIKPVTPFSIHSL